MRQADRPGVITLAALVHPDYPEAVEIFAERLRLYPAGCFVIEAGRDIAGYLLSHPWRAADPPPLNTLLGVLPADAGAYYLHDLALHPALRGTGVAGDILRHLWTTLHARHGAELVAVNGSVPFWRHCGFAVADPPGIAAKLACYGADARFMRRVPGC